MFFTLSWMLIGSSCVSPVSAWPSRPYWRGSTAGCCGSYWPGVGWWCRACPRWAWQGQTPGLPCRERNPDRVGQQPGHSSTEHWLHLLKMLSISFTIFALTDQIQLLRVRLDVLCVENDEDPASTEGKESPGQLHCGHQPPVNKTSATILQLLTSAMSFSWEKNKYKIEKYFLKFTPYHLLTFSLLKPPATKTWSNCLKVETRRTNHKPLELFLAIAQVHHVTRVPLVQSLQFDELHLAVRSEF